MDEFFYDIVEISDDTFIILNDFFSLFVLFLQLFLQSLDFAFLFNQFIPVEVQLKAILILMYFQVSLTDLLKQNHQNLVIFLDFRWNLAHIIAKFLEVVIEFVFIGEQFAQIFLNLTTIICFGCRQVMHSDASEDVIHQLHGAFLWSGQLRNSAHRI